MIIKQEMLFSNKKIFGDTKEHEYLVTCYNGKAIAIPTKDELKENKNAPKRLLLTYPKRSELSAEDKRYCLKYRGIYDEPISKCNSADICMAYGKFN